MYLYLYVLAFLNCILVRSNGACRGKMSNCTGQNVRDPSTWKANHHIGSKPCYHARALWLENRIKICVFRIQASILRLKGKERIGQKHGHSGNTLICRWPQSETWPCSLTHGNPTAQCRNTGTPPSDGPGSTSWLRINVLTWADCTSPPKCHSGGFQVRETRLFGSVTVKNDNMIQ